MGEGLAMGEKNVMGPKSLDSGCAAQLCFPLPDSSRHEMSWKICRFSALAAELGSFAIRRIAAELCLPPPDSSRRKTLGFPSRKSAPRPEPRSALEPPGRTPFRRLFRFSASVDHQMTPPWFARLFRASRSRLAHWRSGCRASLREPSDLKNRAFPG